MIIYHVVIQHPHGKSLYMEALMGQSWIRFGPFSMAISTSTWLGKSKPSSMAGSPFNRESIGNVGINETMIYYIHSVGYN